MVRKKTAASEASTLPFAGPIAEPYHATAEAVLAYYKVSVEPQRTSDYWFITTSTCAALAFSITMIIGTITHGTTHTLVS